MTYLYVAKRRIRGKLHEKSEIAYETAYETPSDDARGKPIEFLRFLSAKCEQLTSQSTNKGQTAKFQRFDNEDVLVVLLLLLLHSNQNKKFLLDCFNQFKDT